MGQKPKTGAPASVTRAAPKEALMKSGPARAQPAVKTEPVAKVEPVAETEPGAIAAPLNVAPAMESEPITVTEPVTVFEEVPVMEEPPIVKVEPVAMAEAQTAPVPPVAVDEAIVPAIATAPAEAVSETLTATANTIAAVAEEAVVAVSSIKPTKPSITQGMKTMMKSTEDLVAFGQANLEAFVKSGQIWSAGVQELTKQFATSAKASFEESVSTLKAMSTAKSVKEAMDLQSTFAKTALEKVMAESNKLTDASIKLTEQTLAPITARVTVAVETFGKAA